jgi:peptidoglycan/xylan/chitin deacetylase (PgdA/CDA1 family)
MAVGTKEKRALPGAVDRTHAPAKRAKPRNSSGRGLLIAVAMMTFLAVAVVFFFIVNQWSISMTLTGEDTLTLEYGTQYEEQGAEARFHGSLLFKDGWSVPVTISGEVDTSKIGTYTITYSAEKFRWKAAISRVVNVQDTQPPVITLTEDPDHYTLPGEDYEEEGFTAIDDYDGDLTDQVVRTVRKDKGKVYYSVKDSSGNEAKVTRRIRYDDPIPPELTLLGDSEITIQAGKDYSEPGWTAEDNCDGDLTDEVTVEGSVDTYTAGTYELVYSVADSYNNVTKVTRTVVVEAVRQPDTVTPTGKIIYLTFDDGPGKYTQTLLDVLDKYNVKVTFFTVNTGYTSLIAKEAAAGHSIGIHSATHDYAQVYASKEAYFDDLNTMQAIIKKQTGSTTTLVRFPGGSSNLVSKKYCAGIMTTLAKALTDQGYQYFDWNVLSGDAGETTSTEQVFQNVINGVQKQDVSVVLQHDIQGFSVNAVEKIIVWGLANGYTFLPLDSTSPTAHQTIAN